MNRTARLEVELEKEVKRYRRFRSAVAAQIEIYSYGVGPPPPEGWESKLTQLKLRIDALIEEIRLTKVDTTLERKLAASVMETKLEEGFPVIRERGKSD